MTPSATQRLERILAEAKAAAAAKAAEKPSEDQRMWQASWRWKRHLSFENLRG
ncbi:hypothetical protein VE03_06404 [Pseudogymnoascus sp. 23342-1-I1]|nr:hypothetical protein VE03_06404 [Pseudogymnoascus sp. 23342-1-I1]